MPGRWWAGAGLFLVAAAGCSACCSRCLTGRGQIVILIWILTFPLGYYLLFFPSRALANHVGSSLRRCLTGHCVLAATNRNITTNFEPAQFGLVLALFPRVRGLAISRAETSWPLSSLRPPGLRPSVAGAGPPGTVFASPLTVPRCLPACIAATLVMAIYVAALWDWRSISANGNLLPLPERYL